MAVFSGAILDPFGFLCRVETAAVTRGVTIETNEEGTQIHEDVPNRLAGELSFKRSVAKYDDLKELGMDMDSDLENLDLKADPPAQPVGDGDEANWVNHLSSRPVAWVPENKRWPEASR